MTRSIKTREIRRVSLGSVMDSEFSHGAYVDADSPCSLSSEAEKNYKKLLAFAVTHSDLVRVRTTLDGLIKLLDLDGKAAESEPYYKRRVGGSDA